MKMKNEHKNENKNWRNNEHKNRNKTHKNNDRNNRVLMITEIIWRINGWINTKKYKKCKKRINKQKFNV